MTAGTEVLVFPYQVRLPWNHSGVVSGAPPLLLRLLDVLAPPVLVARGTKPTNLRGLQYLIERLLLHMCRHPLFGGTKGSGPQVSYCGLESLRLNCT